MGVFDVRCAVSGLILRSGRTLLVPLVRRGKQHVAVGLPIAGDYDRYGQLDPIEDDRIATHFAKCFVARAVIDAPPKPGLKAFVRRMTATDEHAPHPRRKSDRARVRSSWGLRGAGGARRQG